MRYRLSSRKAREKFGFEAKMTLPEGIHTILVEDFGGHLESVNENGLG